jgi:alpha-amylase/alpha-mannosidase (GH57 family)
MSRKTRLAILWHMHQPCYRNPGSGKFDLPWLRLHALKDYFGMVHILEEFPSLHLTFNLVPSLLSGLQLYLDGASDPFSDVYRKPAAELAPDEVQFLVRHFFSTQYENHIKPYRRYDLLYRKKMKQLEQKATPDWQHVFSAAELRDLQTWFQLTYVDEFYKNNDPRINSLIRKGQNFSEADKETAAIVEGEILQRLVPEYRKFQESGQIELCTSPFYHPILPLLLDPQAGRKANPRLAPYDLDFNWEEDAWAQLQTALAFMEKTFGVRPQGIWPSEGSLSEPVLRLLAKAGIAWTASDEEIISRSLPRPLERDSRLMVTDPGALYSPYSLAGLPLKIFFRDHLLSDLIGFYYQKFPAKDAASDLFQRIKAIAASSPEELTIPIILDGENAWEFYPHSGRDFLREFYRLLSEDREIETVTFAAAAAATPGRELQKLKCGSWINGNFDIWIGDRDDQKAWELLKGARDAFHAAKDRLAPERVREIEELLHIAEGSDWFWWYGKENYTPDIDVFDNLFRLNLQKIYELLGNPSPDDLLRPIPASTPANHMQIVAPRDTMEVNVDGEVSDYFEWLDSGRVDILSYGGAMNIANPLVKTLFFGFDRDHVFLRIDTKKNARTYFENGFSLRLSLLGSGESWQGQIGFDGQAPTMMNFSVGSSGAVGRIIELKIPLSTLNVKPGGEFQMQLFWFFQDHPFQTIPTLEPLKIKVPNAKDYAAFWQV